MSEQGYVYENFGQFRDEDGFCVLERIEFDGVDIPMGGTILTSINGEVYDVSRYGEERLISIKEIIGAKPKKRSAKYAFTKPSCPYTIRFEAKTWQRKAWDCIYPGIDWKNKSEFRRFGKWDSTMRHMLRVGLSLKVRGDDAGSSRPVVADITEELDGKVPHNGMYLLIDTPEQFETVLKTWHTMVYRNIDKYLDLAQKRYKQESIAYIQKVMIIYDDQSYSCFTGNPLILEEVFNQPFDREGNTRLRYRKKD